MSLWDLFDAAYYTPEMADLGLTITPGLTEIPYSGFDYLGNGADDFSWQPAQYDLSRAMMATDDDYNWSPVEHGLTRTMMQTDDDYSWTPEEYDATRASVRALPSPPAPPSARGDLGDLADAIRRGTSNNSGNAFAFPKFDVPDLPPVAPGPSVGGVPQTPAPAPFTPLNVNVPLPERESDLRGLARLLRDR